MRTCRCKKQPPFEHLLSSQIIMQSGSMGLRLPHIAFQPWTLSAAHGATDVDYAHGKAGGASLGCFINAGLVGIDFIHHPVLRRRQKRQGKSLLGSLAHAGAIG